MKFEITPSDRNDTTLIKLTVEQINKDFNLTGHDFHFSGIKEKAYQELIDQLAPILEAMLKTDTEKLMSVLYQIDVPESVFRSIQFASSDHDYQLLAHSIIEREFKKILIRSYYKSQRPLDENSP